MTQMYEQANQVEQAYASHRDGPKRATSHPWRPPLNLGMCPLVAKLAAAPVSNAGAAKLATGPSVTRFLSRRTSLNQAAAPSTLAAAARENGAD